MKLTIATLAMAFGASAVSAFSSSPAAAAVPLDERPIYDPLGLYPKSSPERLSGRILPIEAENVFNTQTVTDPLNLYSDKSKIEANADMSRSLPFLPRPKHLDGSMAGDFGFDPLGLAAAADDDAGSSSGRLAFMREAELKHARIAMLAALGWPAAELFHGKIASVLGLRSLLQFGDRVPSVLNGGLGHAVEPFWPLMAAALVFAGGVEIVHEYDKRANPERYADRAPGDLGFDPFRLFGSKGDTAAAKRNMELAEIKNGRLAMLAVTAFAFQEAFTGAGIIPQLAAWFHPHSSEFLADQGFASNIQAVLDGAL